MGYERLQFKFSYIIDAEQHKNQKRAAVQALRVFFDSQGTEKMDGVHVIGSWRNPDNNNVAHAEWKTSDDIGQSIEDFYKTLHGSRGALWAAEQQNRKDYQKYAGTSEIPRRRSKGPKPRRRIVSKVVKRRDGGKLVRVNRVAKRKGKVAPAKAKGKTGRNRRNKPLR